MKVLWGRARFRWASPDESFRFRGDSERIVEKRTLTVISCATTRAEAVVPSIRPRTRPSRRKQRGGREEGGRNNLYPALCKKSYPQTGVLAGNSAVATV